MNNTHLSGHHIRFNGGQRELSKSSGRFVILPRRIFIRCAAAKDSRTFRSRLARIQSGGFDGDPSRLDLGLLRYRDFENTVAALRSNAFGIGCLREREPAVKLAADSFYPF